MLRAKYFFFIFTLLYAEVEMIFIGSENLTHIIRESTYPPHVIKSKSQLVYVSFHRTDGSTFVITLESTLIPTKYCEVRTIIPPSRDFSSPLTYALGNGQVIVSFLDKSDEFVFQDDHPNLQLFVIDLEANCTYIKKILQLDAAVIQSSNAVYYYVLPHYDTFDIHLTSNLYCNMNVIAENDNSCIARFSNLGDFVGTFHLDLGKTREISLEQDGMIYTARENDATDGYFYTSHRPNENLLIVRKLDADFKVQKKRRFRDSLVASSAANGYFSLCLLVDRQTDGDRQRVECVKMDLELNIIFDVSFDDCQNRNFGIYNLANDKSLIISASKSNLTTETRLFQTVLEFKFGEAVVDEYDCKVNSASYFHFAELKAEKYCLSFWCDFKGMITKCFKTLHAEKGPSYSGLYKTSCQTF